MLYTVSYVCICYKVALYLIDPHRYMLIWLYGDQCDGIQSILIDLPLYSDYIKDIFEGKLYNVLSIACQCHERF